jgi:hypothetical protein
LALYTQSANVESDINKQKQSGNIMSEKLNLNDYETVDRVPGLPGVLEATPKEGEPVRFKENLLTTPMQRAKRDGYNMAAQDLGHEIPEDSWPEPEKVEEKKAKWQSLYDGLRDATVVGDGEALPDGRETYKTLEWGDIPKEEIHFEAETISRTEISPEPIPVQPDPIEITPDPEPNPELQNLRQEVKELREEVGRLTSLLAEALEQNKSLQKQLAEARGEKPEDKEDKLEDLKVGQQVRAHSKARMKFEDDWTIQKIEDKDGVKTAWLTKPGSKNKLRGEPEELTLEVPYDRLLAWQNENSDDVESASPAETGEDGDEDFKPGQKVNVFSYKDRELQENWEVVKVYTDDEGVIQVEVKSPDGETGSWPKDKLLALQDLEYEKEPLPAGIWARLKERFNRAKDRIRGERDAATTAAIVGGPNSTPEQQRRKRRLAFLAGAIGGAAVAALICDMTHEGGLIDGTWLDDGGNKGLGSGNGQGESTPNGAGYGDVTVNGGPGNDNIDVNIYPEGTEGGTDADTGNGGNPSAGVGNEGNDTNAPEAVNTGETFKVEYGNGVTHEIQQYAQAKGINISNEDAFRIYEQLEANQHDKIIDLHGTSADSYWHVDPQSGPEVRIASPGTATWYPEAESQLRSALGLG